MKYYISRGGQQYGPYALADLQNMLAQGQVAANDLAWGEGMPEWLPLSQVLGSAAGSTPAPQPYAPAAPQHPPQQTPQQAQYQPPQAQYGAPPYNPNPAYNAYATPTPGAGPAPPSLHWALVLILTIVTCGIFGLVWAFVEANFVKKLDPKSKAILFFALVVLCACANWALAFMIFGALRSGGLGAASGIRALSNIIAIASWVLYLIAVYGMKSSLENYYNSVEPIGLRLNGVMVFFFAIFYFQYHFTRIAQWKQTGRLA